MGARELAALNDLAPIWEHIPGIQFWIKDLQGRFVAANPEFYRHFGFASFAQLRGKTDSDVSPWDLAREYALDDRAVLASGRAQIEKLELVREREGGLHWYATTKTPLRDAQGKAWGTAGYTRKLGMREAGKSNIRGIGTVVEHIQANHAKPLEIPALARLAGLSVAQFERRFKALLRESPVRYLNRVRMRAACQLLLHTDLSVGEISRRAGFADPSYFTKRFQAHLRIRPLEYRRKYAPGIAPE